MIKFSRLVLLLLPLFLFACGAPLADAENMETAENTETTENVEGVEEECIYQVGDQYVVRFDDTQTENPPEGMEWILNDENVQIVEEDGITYVYAYYYSDGMNPQMLMQMAEIGAYGEITEAVSSQVDYQIQITLNNIGVDDAQKEMVLTTVKNVRSNATLTGLQMYARLLGRVDTIKTVDADTCQITLENNPKFRVYMLYKIPYTQFQTFRDQILEDAHNQISDDEASQILEQVDDSLAEIDQNPSSI